MKKTAADQIVEMMIDAGIQRVYGVVGDSINPIVDAIRRTNGKLRWVHCRNEEVAAFAAGADALLTGQIAACAGSCGPGNLHLIQGLYNSHRNRAPFSRSPARCQRGSSAPNTFRKRIPRGSSGIAPIIVKRLTLRSKRPQ